MLHLDHPTSLVTVVASVNYHRGRAFSIDYGWVVPSLCYITGALATTTDSLNILSMSLGRVFFDVRVLD